MKAIRWTGRSVRLEDVPLPEPAAGEVVLRLRAAAIGATEQAFLDCRLVPDVPEGTGFTLGSEFTADVVSDPTGTLTSARVVPLPSIPCGACGSCIAGMPGLCSVRIAPGRSSRHGCLSELFPFPARGLFPLPPHVRDYDAISLLPLASALTLPERVPLNDRVLVVSAGGLGLVVAAALKHHRQPVFLTLPREDVVESVRKFGLLHDPGGRFDLVVAACDGPGVLENALYRAQPRGTVAVLGVPAWTAAGHPANAATADRPLGSGSQSSTVAPGSLPLLVRNELTVVGLGEGDIAAALERLAAREVCEILSRGRPAVFPLERGQEALHHAADPRNLRVVVDNLTH